MRSTLRSIAAAFTHSGSSYRAAPRPGSTLERTSFLDALTHSGPSYEVGLSRKLSRAECQKIAKEELEPLLDHLRTLFMQGAEKVTALDPKNVEQSREALVDLESLLSQQIEVIELDFIEITNRLRRGLDPFDLRGHRTLRKHRNQLLEIAKDLRQVHAAVSEVLREIRKSETAGHRDQSGPTDFTSSLLFVVSAIFRRLDGATESLLTPS